MSSNATPFTLGRGAVVTMAAYGATSTPVPINGLKTISFSGSQASYDDITNMGSPAGVPGGAPVNEYAPTTVTPGTAAIQGVFNDDDPGQVALAAAKYTQILQTFVIQFLPKPGQTKGFQRTINAYVQECNGPDAQYDKAATLSATLKLTGPPADVAGS